MPKILGDPERTPPCFDLESCFLQGAQKLWVYQQKGVIFMWEEPEEFGPGGQRIIDGLGGGGNDAATESLVVEAARAKDRLDRLNRITSGDEDVWTRIFQAEGEVVLKMDTAVSEQRQLATVYRQILTEIQRRQGDRVSDDEEDGFADL